MKARVLIILLVLIGLGLNSCLSDCRIEYNFPDAPEKNYIIRGRLLYSCANPTAVKGKVLTLLGEDGYNDNRIDTTTDSLGNFTFYGKYDFRQNRLFADYFNNDGLLYNFLPSQNYTLGDVYLYSSSAIPKTIPCVVSYSLANTKFKDGDSVYLDFQLLHPKNKQKLYTNLADFAKQDTILIDEAKLGGLVHPVFAVGGNYNLFLKLRTKGLGIQRQYKVFNRCITQEIVVPIP